MHVSQNACNSKRLSIQQNGLKNCDFVGIVDGVKCETHGYLWTVYEVRLAPVFKVILRSFGVLVLKWPVNQKRLVIEQNVLAFGIY